MPNQSKFVNIPEWIKLKRYPHIGLPISPRHVASIRKYVETPEKIASHAFMPFIRRKMVSHPHRLNPDTNKKEPKRKVRELTYASHVDSVIFSYYADRLQHRYEDFVRKNHLDDVVVAYRKIRCQDGKGNKCNIHIAGDVFQYVKSQLKLDKEVALITFDIKGFFDNLDHKIVKQTWKQIMGYNDMPKDEYNVYKHATKYSYVIDEKLFYLFKDRILCESNGGVVPHKVKALKYMRNRKAVAFCDRSDIDAIRKSGYIQGHTDSKGIPQGLPISAVLANIYMCNFDLDIASKVKASNGIYKRYSDDIVVVCPIKDARYWRDYVINHIKSVNLEIQPEKTNLYELHKIHGRTMCIHETEGLNKKIEYLGFSFDGENVLIKSAGVGKYYYKMSRAKRRHKRWAISINNSTSGYVFEHPLFKRYSLAGSRRHQIRKKVGKKFLKTGRKGYGNYLTYVLKASEVLHEPKIRRQLRRNLNKLKKSINEIYAEIKRVENARLMAMMYGH